MTRGLRKMKREITSLADRLRRDESGAVFILVAIGIVLLLGLGSLAIDVSRIAYAQRALQATTDLAAQAGATEIYNGAGISAITTATNYSAMQGDNNVQHGLNVTSVSATLHAVNGTSSGGCPTTSAELQSYPACTSNSPNGTSPACTTSGGCNAIVVTQQAQVSLTLGEVFGIGSVTLSASALAVGKGGAFPPLNIMLIIDNTDSMNDVDQQGVSCGGISNATRIQCALAGAQTLLSELYPSQDQVGLMVFPGVDTNASDTANGVTSVSNDGACSSSVKSICASTCNPSTGKCSCNGGSADIVLVPYNASPQYQLVTPTNSGGGSTNSFCGVSQGSCGTSTAMSTSSPIVSATCQSGMSVGSTSCGTGSSGCAGEQVKGGEGTYFADAINVAQSTLVSTNQTGVCATRTCQNVIIILSDGGAGNAGDSEGADANTSSEALAGVTTLTFATVPSSVVAGSTVADNTNTSAIPAGTTVVSATDSTVTLSAAVNNLGTAATSTAASNTETLTFLSGSLPSKLATGASVSDTASAIPAGTTVSGCSANPCSSGTTVTLSKQVTVAKGDTIAFGFVGQGDQIAFSSNNQCNEAITAAHNAAKAGTWVYSIAYGSGVGDQQQSQDTVANLGDYTSCSDTETPKVNSCYTMSQIASSPSAIPDSTKFYSDPMGGSCVSPSNPSATSVPSIFENIGYNLQYTTLLACGTTEAANFCSGNH
jgi:Flp pilus assembly protein TadG